MRTRIALLIGVLAPTSFCAAQQPPDVSTTTAAPPPTLSLVVPNAAVGGDWLPMGFVLSAPAAQDLHVLLATDNPSVPAAGRVTLSRGMRERRLAVRTKAVDAPQTAVITASLGGAVQSATVTLSPRPATPQNGPVSFHGTLSPAVSGAKVTIAGREAVTGPDGSFTIDGLPPGPARVHVSVDGYEGSSVIVVED